jgi:L-ascorbate metabolism protein UlaG (beta-lactamase superfamily)
MDQRGQNHRLKPPLKVNFMFNQSFPGFTFLFISILCAGTQAHDSTAMYLANEGLMVKHGDTRILFDPLFRESYGHYLLLPEAMKEALFAGEAPYDGIDAVFISHHHGDHFSPADMVRLMKEQSEIRLFAPNQAVQAMRSETGISDAAIFDRVTAVNLAYRDAPVTLEMEGLLIEAVRIPHSGWPTGRLDIENISWRVTLDEATTVLHMGDADANDVHFSRDATYWNKNNPDMAFPPYWFLSSSSGQEILQNRIKPGRSVGVHVPVKIPSEPTLRPAELRSVDLFTRPGETRHIKTAH